MPIFDQGYQHWDGELSGHTWRWWAITRHGFRAGLKNRFVRYVLIAAWAPALGLVVAVCLWGMIERRSTMVTTLMQFMSFLQPSLVADPRHYRVDIWRLAYALFLYIELRFSMILILLVGPALISQDLRFNTLPLYFSRPLRRIDYFLGKLGVIVLFLALVMILPSLVAYILGMLFSLDLSIIRDTFPILLGSLAYGAIIALSAGLLMLALSCVSRNSRYVALFWLIVWFVSAILSAALQSTDSFEREYRYYHAIERPEFRGGRTRQQMAGDFPQWLAARRAAAEQYRIAELEHSKTDWRPLVSYVSNLSRIGQQLLGTNQSLDTIADLDTNEYSRDRLLIAYRGPEYPWIWSAAVLAGLFGLSACILMLSIKSLDRLK